jgi:AraC family transcriptional regulator
MWYQISNDTARMNMSSELASPVWKPQRTTRVVHSGLTFMHGGPVGMHLPEHEHDEVQLEMHFTSARRPNGQQLGMKAGLFNLLPSGKPHVGKWDDNTEVVVALISRRQMEGAADELLRHGRAESAEVICGVDPLFQSCSILLREEFLSGRIKDRLLVEAVGTVLSAWLVRQWSHGSTSRRITGRLSAQQLKKTMEIIEHHPNGGPSISDLADALGMGTHQFTRQFSASVGSTPYQYIVRNRLERARTLLERTPLPIADIALEVGFVSQSHLTETFRRHLHLTPAMHRANKQGK